MDELSRYVALVERACAYVKAHGENPARTIEYITLRALARRLRVSIALAEQICEDSDNRLMRHYLAPGAALGDTTMEYLG